MYDLQENSVRVVDGRLFTGNGKLLYNPSILAVKDVLYQVGNYEELYTSMISMGNSLSEDIRIISFEKFSVYDICYIIRRVDEFTDTHFMGNLLNSHDLISWLNTEKIKFPLQVEEEK